MEENLELEIRGNYGHSATEEIEQDFIPYELEEDEQF